MRGVGTSTPLWQGRKSAPNRELRERHLLGTRTPSRTCWRLTSGLPGLPLASSPPGPTFSFSDSWATARVRLCDAPAAGGHPCHHSQGEREPGSGRTRGRGLQSTLGPPMHAPVPSPSRPAPSPCPGCSIPSALLSAPNTLMPCTCPSLQSARPGLRPICLLEHGQEAPGC